MKIKYGNGYSMSTYYLNSGCNSKPTISTNAISNATYYSFLNLDIIASSSIGLSQVAGVLIKDGKPYSQYIGFSENVSGTSFSNSYSIDITSIPEGSYRFDLFAKDTSEQQSDSFKYYFTKGDTTINLSDYNPNWSGSIEFLDTNNNKLAVPSNAKIRITPEVEQTDNWGGIVIPINSDGTWATTTLRIDPSHYTSSLKYQFVIFNDSNNDGFWNLGEDTYGGFMENNPSISTVNYFNNQVIKTVKVTGYYSGYYTFTDSLNQPSWVVDSWGSCSGSCGINNATQTRDVYCKSSYYNTLSDSFCNASSKPPSSQSCTSCYDNVDTSTPKITSLSPTKTDLDKSTSFTINGENLPSTIALSLEDGECKSVYFYGSWAKIICTPRKSGLKRFYVGEYSGGPAIEGSLNLYVDVQ
jgi:hypothetical protein